MVGEQPLGMRAASLRRTRNRPCAASPGGGRAVQRAAVDRTSPGRGRLTTRAPRRRTPREVAFDSCVRGGATRFGTSVRGQTGGAAERSTTAAAGAAPPPSRLGREPPGVPAPPMRDTMPARESAALPWPSVGEHRRLLQSLGRGCEHGWHSHDHRGVWEIAHVQRHCRAWRGGNE